MISDYLASLGRHVTTDEIDREHLIYLLKKHRNLRTAAEEAKVTVKTMYNRINRFGLRTFYQDVCPDQRLSARQASVGRDRPSLDD